MARARCPVCRGSVERSDDAFPFCSRRCRAVDLGGWLGEAYRVADGPSAELEDMAIREQLSDEAHEDEWPSA